jgi:acyl carrier protein
MVPSRFIPVPTLPLTASGKLDRLRLPAPDPGTLAASADPIGPRTDTEAIVAKVWREVLGLEQINVHDSFFELGGNSLLAAQLVGRLARQTRSEVPVRAVLENETVAKLASYLDGHARRVAARSPEADDREVIEL